MENGLAGPQKLNTEWSNSIPKYIGKELKTGVETNTCHKYS